MSKPTKRLTITGIVRKVTEEEEPYVQSLWYDRFWWDEDNENEEEESDALEQDDSTKEATTESKDKATRTRWKVVGGAPAAFKAEGKAPRRSSSKGSLVEVDEQRSRKTSDPTNSNTEIDSKSHASNVVRDNSSTDEASTLVEGDLEEGDGESVEGEWTEESASWDVGTTFYKLEMLSMQLDLNSGLQVSLILHSTLSCVLVFSCRCLLTITGLVCVPEIHRNTGFQ